MRSGLWCSGIRDSGFDALLWTGGVRPRWRVVTTVVNFRSPKGVVQATTPNQQPSTLNQQPSTLNQQPQPPFVLETVGEAHSLCVHF
jgi:hypothetical protein